jgi:tetratricopeptide (TPR) repeat protein
VIADAWEATPVDSSGRRDAAIADHLYHADGGRRAIDALRNVARQAAALYANRTACEQIDRALELADHTPLPREQLAALQLERAELSASLGDLPDAIERFAPHVAAVSAGEQSARAALGLAHALRLAGRYDEADDLLDEIGAAELVAPARLALERAGVDLMEGHMRDAIAECDPYLAQPGAAPYDSELLLIRAQARAGLDEPERAIADAELALSLARAARAASIEARALRVLGGLYDEVDRLDDAAGALHQALDAAEAAGDVGELAGCLVNLAFVEQRRGDLQRTIALDRRAVAELHRIGHGFEAGARANLAHHLVDADALDEAGPATTQALAAAIRVGDELARADSLYAAARLAMATGDRDGAVAQAEESLALLHEIGTAAMVPDLEALLAAARQGGAATVTSGTSLD